MTKDEWYKIIQSIQRIQDLNLSLQIPINIRQEIRKECFFILTKIGEMNK